MNLAGTAFSIPEGWDVSHISEHAFSARFNAHEGKAHLVCHPLLPGLMLMDIELSCPHLPVSYPVTANPYTINWCLQGRCEVDLGRAGSIVVGEGMLCISHEAANAFAYPTHLYRGFEYLIDLEQLDDTSRSLLSSFGLTQPAIQDIFETQQPALVFTPSEELLAIVARVEQLLQNDSTQHERLLLESVNLLMCLLPDRRGSINSSGVYLQRSQRDMAEAVLAQILASTSTTVNLESLAASLCVSEASLRSYFSKVYGTSPAAYARNYHLDEAARQLAQSNERVSDVAARAGYANASKFAAAFARRFGTSPVEYRRRSRLENMGQADGREYASS